MKNRRRTNMQMILNTGQWHTDIGWVHTYSNGDWVIVFHDENDHDCGYLDNDQANLRSHIPVKTMPTKEQVLKYGLAAFTATGEKANLIMMNDLGV